MQVRFIRLVDERFAGVSQTRNTLEMKEEIVRNLMEKYNDLVAEGKSEEAAFHIAASTIGDIGDLIDDPGLKEPHAPEPTPDYDSYYSEAEASPENLRHRSASAIALSVMMYILCPLPVIIFQNSMGLILLFVMIACATGMLIYNGMTTAKPGAEGEPSAEAGQPPMSRAKGSPSSAEQYPREDEQKKAAADKRRIARSLASAFWCFTVVVYFLVSFYTDAWHISWTIFLIAVAVNNVIRAFLEVGRK